MVLKLSGLFFMYLLCFVFYVPVMFRFLCIKLRFFMHLLCFVFMYLLCFLLNLTISKISIFLFLNRIVFLNRSLYKQDVQITADHSNPNPNSNTLTPPLSSLVKLMANRCVLCIYVCVCVCGLLSLPTNPVQSLKIDNRARYVSVALSLWVVLSPPHLLHCWRSHMWPAEIGLHKKVFFGYTSTYLLQIAV